MLGPKKVDIVSPDHLWPARGGGGFPLTGRDCHHPRSHHQAVQAPHALAEVVVVANAADADWTKRNALALGAGMRTSSNDSALHFSWHGTGAYSPKRAV
jgi:hypothetical protein